MQPDIFRFLQSSNKCNRKHLFYNRFISHLVLNQMAFYGLSRKAEGNCFVNNSQKFLRSTKKVCRCR